jgi:hypothetical protein
MTKNEIRLVLLKIIQIYLRQTEYKCVEINYIFLELLWSNPKSVQLHLNIELLCLKLHGYNYSFA